MKKSGIWLDYKEAHIIHLIDSEVEVEHILSKVDDSHPKGGSRSKNPWGPMDIMAEGKYLEKRKHQLKSYYRELIDALSGSEEVYIFGPAEAKTGLVSQFKSLKKSPPIARISSADSMTLNQKIAEVKSFFDKKN